MTPLPLLHILVTTGIDRVVAVRPYQPMPPRRLGPGQQPGGRSTSDGTVAATSRRGGEVSRHRGLAAAAGASAALHAAALAWAWALPAPTFDVTAERPVTIAATAFDVRLTPPAAAPPPHPPVPPPAPTPALAKPPVSTTPRPTVARRRALESSVPAPAALPVQAAQQGTIVVPGAAEQAPALAAPAQAAAALAPPPVAPSAAPAAQPGPAFDAAGYGLAVRKRVETRKRYPQQAADAGEEGEVEVRVRIAPDGSLRQAPEVVRSSGVPALDREAVRMVRAAAPFPPVSDPAGAELVVPIVFELQDEDF